MLKKTIHIGKTLGPYSPAIEIEGAGKVLFISGQIGIDPEHGELVSPEFEKQAEQVLKNLNTVLEKANHSLQNIVKATIYLTDLNNFAVINEVYKKHFNEPFPARTTIQVAALPKGALVEIEAIAVK